MSTVFYRIYGGIEGAIKGKTVRKLPAEVNTDENTTAIPRSLANELKKVTMALDIFYVERMPFLTSISRKLMFTTGKAIKNRKHDEVMAAIVEVASFYKMHGHQIEFIMSDNEFGPLKEKIRKAVGAELNLAAPDEHVPEVERNIRVIKDRLRSMLAGMPYKRIPRHFKRELALTCITMLNVVPREASVSSSLSPMELLSGRSLDFKKHCVLPPGAYCLVHEEGVPRNSMRERATGAIAIGPTTNLQGSYRFLSLKSGHIITRREWTVMPVPPEAIEKVEEMAGGGDMTVSFTYRNVNYSTADLEPIQEGNDDDVVEREEGEALVEEIESGAEPDENTTEVEVGEEVDDVEDLADGDELFDGGENMNNEILVGNEDIEVEEAPLFDDHSTDPEPPIEKTWSGLADHAAEPGGPAMRTRSATATTGRKYFWRLEDGERMRNEHQFLADWEIGEVFTQFTLNKGLKTLGKRAEKGVIKELHQFVEKDVLRPISLEKLTKEKERRALRLIMLVKEKRDGTVKGRGCCDGSGQRGFINEFDATSPTVSTEALAISCAIDAYEKRKVMTVDIPGAYLHCHMDSEEYVLLEGVLVDLYLKADPIAAGKVTSSSSGTKRLYTRMNKALYGHMRSGRLFYEHISKTLKDLGFTHNPDELCIWNRDIGGHQMTVVLYVDDLKVSFHNDEGLREFMGSLEEVYGPLEPKEGSVFDYCGITLDYGTSGVCKLSTPTYIDTAIDDFELVHGKIRKGAKTPAQVNLFKINENATTLNETKRKTFHSVFARLLWVGVKTRPDILVALSFLGKRTSKADDDDWMKLERLLSYLQDTRDSPLTLGIESLQVVKWWTDASFAVHHDLKSHSGVLGSLGRGAIFAKSRAQKLNTISSTESEVVASSEALAQALWTTSFLKHQGYNVKNALLHQDNQAAIRLHENGIMSRKKGSRHIDIRFFFLKDRIDRGEVEIAFCGTEHMVADFLSKPLQGSVFRRFRDAIMGCERKRKEGVC